MKALPVSLVLVAVAAAAGAWLALRSTEAQLPTAAASAPPAAPALRSQAKSASLAPSAVLAIDPRTKGPQGSTVVAPRSALFNDFLAAKQYKPLYDRLKSTADGQTPEGWYLMYEMLRKCATITDSRRPQRPPSPKRDEFLATLSSADPQRDKRIAAFDENQANRCAGFEGTQVTMAELNKLVGDAASAGEPKAKAASVEQEIWRERRAAGSEQRWGRDSVTLTDGQIDTLRQAASSGDPEAMLIAGRLLSNTWHDLTVRLGADGQVVEQRAFYNAWQVLACDYGYPCGESNARLLSECAFNGHCDAASLPDYLFYYASSPHDSQLLTQYREILRNAIQSGDWSQLSFARGPRPPGQSRFVFSPRSFAISE